MILELKNIYKTYMQGKLDVPVLKNVSLSVEEGEYLAIMGPSGSGKTTLMNIIGCLDIPTSGEYLLEGQELSNETDLKLSQVRLHSIGFVFQSFHLLPRQSALENVALPLLYAGVKKKERLEMARKALERVGLGDRTEFKPTQLSGGQCQRVAIARAIVNNPKILLADEPTGALDTTAGEQIMEVFQRLNDEGVTIVMITHEPQIAAHAQRTLHIRDGRLTDPQGNFVSAETEAAPAEAEQLPVAQTPVRQQIAAPIAARAVTASQEEPVAEAVRETVAVDIPSIFEEPEKAAETEDIFQQFDPFAAELAAADAAAKEQSTVGEPASALETTAPEVPEQDGSEQVAETGAILETMPETGELPTPAVEKPAATDAQDDPQMETFQDGVEADTFLDTEIAALLDAGENDDFDIGDDFLAKVGILSGKPEAPAETLENPALIARSTKSGAPAQISFDIWAEPEDDFDTAAAEFAAETSEPAAEDPAADPAKKEPEETTAREHLPEDNPVEEAVPQGTGNGGKSDVEDTEDDSFDTAFAFDVAEDTRQTQPDTGEFGAPLKTELDLSRLWDAAEDAPAPSEVQDKPAAPAEPIVPAPGASPKKLIEIEDIKVDFDDEI